MKLIKYIKQLYKDFINDKTSCVDCEKEMFIGVIENNQGFCDECIKKVCNG